MNFDGNFYVKPIWKNQAYQLIYKFHYSKVLPKLNKYFIWCFVDDLLVWVITLWWGVRPLHTIKKLFPSLWTRDYYEIWKMCFDDAMPKNTESKFISLMLDWVKKNDTVKIIFTRADWMLWKPWYVYQASNFLYWWFIFTDSYFWPDWEKIHPRMTNKIWGRPNKEKQKELWWKHYQWKQFRYIYFVCDKRTKKKLEKECTVILNKEYPKHKDLYWKIQTDKWYIQSEKPEFISKNINFYLSKKWETAPQLFTSI